MNINQPGTMGGDYNVQAQPLYHQDSQYSAGNQFSYNDYNNSDGHDYSYNYQDYYYDDNAEPEEDMAAERDLAEDAQWKMIQKNTFTRWANEHLKLVNKNVSELEFDLSDGLRFISLIEVLSGKKFQKYNKRPNFRTQKLENVTMCLQFLEEDEGIKIVNIDSKDIVDHKLKLILGLIWTLILHYSISMPTWEGDMDRPDRTPKQKLLNWIQNKIPDKPIQNFSTDWNDGTAIGALVDAMAPGLCPEWQDWSPQNAIPNATEAMNAAEQSLDIPQLIKPAEMCNPKVDELSMITYLSQFPNAKLKGGAPLRPKVNPARIKAYGRVNSDMPSIASLCCHATGRNIQPTGMRDGDDLNIKVIRPGGTEEKVRAALANERIQKIVETLQFYKTSKDINSMLKEFIKLEKAFMETKKDLNSSTCEVIKRVVEDIGNFIKNLKEKDYKKNKRSVGRLEKNLNKLCKELKAHIPKPGPIQGHQGDDIEDNHNSDQMSNNSDQMSNNSDQMSNNSDQMSNNSDQMSNNSNQMSNNSNQMSNNGERYDNVSNVTWTEDEEDEEGDEIINNSQSVLNNARPADYYKKKTQPNVDEVVGKKRSKAKEVIAKEAEDSDSDNVGEEERVQIFRNGAKITLETVSDKLVELTEGRGKKGTYKQIKRLIELRRIAREKELGDPLDCKIIFCIIAATFDCKMSALSSMMPEIWQKCIHYTWELSATILKNIDTIIIGEHNDDENFDEKNPPCMIRGCILSVVEWMDDEFMKMLQDCGDRGTNYVERLKDETKICEIIEVMAKYLAMHGTDSDNYRIHLKRMQHVYYKTLSDQSALMTDLGNLIIYNHIAPDSVKEQATLMYIYHQSIHNRFSGPSEIAGSSKILNEYRQLIPPLKVLYNRTVAQFGMCCFRAGDFESAYIHLKHFLTLDIARKLLAQELAPRTEVEKRSQMAYHTHINLQVLEAFNLISSMLTEAPVIAVSAFEFRKKREGVNLYRLLKKSSDFPPESIKEHILWACKSILKGDWKSCLKYITTESMYQKLWNRFNNKEVIINAIKSKICEVSMRIYLVSSTAIHIKFPFESLKEMFSLSDRVIESIASRMIFYEGFSARIEQHEITISGKKSVSSFIVPQPEINRNQKLALELANKIEKLYHPGYVSAYLVLFEKDSFTQKLTGLLNVALVDLISEDFEQEDIERFYQFNEFIEHFESDEALIKVGCKVEEIFWLVLNSGEPETTDPPYNRVEYFIWLSLFGKQLLSKLRPALAAKWPLCFKAWQLFQDSRRCSGCAPIFDKRLMLMVQNQEGKWSMPKGKAALFEKSHETARREMREETGVDHVVQETDTSYKHEKTEIFVVHLAEQRMDLKPDGREITGIG